MQQYNSECETAKAQKKKGKQEKIMHHGDDSSHVHTKTYDTLPEKKYK
jgi:hypothetical protein